MFSIVVPLDFTYKKLKGIDSYIGEIENGKSSFSFDYGIYSPRPPITKEQFLDDNRKHIDYESAELFFELIDLKPYQDKDNRVNPIKITKKIKNLALNIMNDSIILSRGQDKSCEYYYSFDFANKGYKIPFCISQENLDNFKYYEITTDTINGFKRILSIWKNEKTENYSNVNLIPLSNDSDKMELWVGIKSSTQMSIQQIKEILKTVEIKK